MLAGVLLHEHLIARASRDGSGPFLTHYAGDERTELSARSFANWTAKTANLLTDGLGLDPGDRVELRLAAERPGHWMTLVWVMAAWQAGLTVVASDGDVVVTGPEPASGEAPGVPALACSLHPLGLGLRDLPPGWTDFSAATLAQPDAWFGTGPESPDDTAWDLAGRTATFAELTAATPTGARRLVVDPADAWAAATRCLVEPLLGGGSSVVVTGATEDALARIAQNEKVDS